MFPVHVVFLEFVIDPACTLVFETERTEEGAMQRPPRSPQAPLFDLAMLGTSLAIGVTMLASAMAAYWWALQTGYTDGETRAVAFVAVVAGNLALLFAMRSRSRTILQTLGTRNTALWGISAAALAALVTAIYVPWAAEIFRFAPLGPLELAVSAASGIAGVIWYEAWKLLRGRSQKSLFSRA